jgi:hypothetical protein
MQTKAANLGRALASLFSSIFPKTVDIELRADTSQHSDLLYFEPLVKHQGIAYRFSDLGNIPSRIKIGSKYFRISQKNRQTLRKLSEWDPTFDPQKGFVFHEKDVPDVLSYLRTKGSADLSASAKKVIVDPRPLQLLHAVDERGDVIDVHTALSDPDSRVKIDDKLQARFLVDSQYVHASEGFFKKPEKTEFKVLSSDVGVQTLTGQQIPLFLLYDLKNIARERTSSISPAVAAKKVTTGTFEPKVSVDVEGPWIWFDVRYQADRFQIPFSGIEAEPKTSQFLKADKDNWVQIDRATHQKLKERIENIPEVQEDGDGFRAPTWRYGEVQALLDAVAKIDASEAFQRFIRSLENFSAIEERPLPSSLRGDALRDYQKHGYHWLCFLRDYGLNGILADEMGLGKTVQMLTALLDSHSYADVPASLIVCPPSVLSAWEDDIRRFSSAADFRVGRFTGSNRKRVLGDIAHYDAVLTTYTTVARDIEVLSKIAWKYVVLDEAQKIKNHQTATSKSCKRLVAHHKIALTGTPIENRLSELWSIFDFLMPSYLGSQTSFKNKFEIPIMKRGIRTATEELKKKINPFKLRRLKSQVAKELPEKILMDRYCELTPEQVQLYRQFASTESERIRDLPGDVVRVDTSILTAILRLKQICCHPALIRRDFERIADRSGKLEAFEEIIEELVESGEKALVFSQFTEMLSILRTVLEEKGIKYFYLDGQTPEKERAKLKHDFQNKLAPFFLISLRAGGLGMTLTEANCVIHYDRWWNPAVEDQATDRVHRIGQTKSVRVFRIHTKGTIEERIGQLIVKKKDLFDSVIEVDDLKKEISKADLLALFAPPSVAAR